MRNNDLFDTLSAVGLIAFVALFWTVLAVHSWGRYQTEQQCLKHGFSGYRYSLIGSEYCVIRQDQTDIVVPFYEAIRK